VCVHMKRSWILLLLRDRGVRRSLSWPHASGSIWQQVPHPMAFEVLESLIIASLWAALRLWLQDAWHHRWSKRSWCAVAKFKFIFFRYITFLFLMVNPLGWLPEVTHVKTSGISSFYLQGCSKVHKNSYSQFRLFASLTDRPNTCMCLF